MGLGGKRQTLWTLREKERAEETIWLPPRDSNPDNLLQRQVS
jgi:hypothetical protein